MREYVPKLGQAYIRIIGERLGRFVEFEFSIDDRDLTVELILPHEAFSRFCERHRARLISHPAEIGDAAQRGRRPGLYRRPAR